MRALTGRAPWVVARAAVLVVALAALTPAVPIGPSMVRAGGGLVTVMDATYDTTIA